MTSMTQAWGVTSYGPVEMLKLLEYPIREPDNGEIIIDVEAVSLNPLDLKIITGVMKDVMPVSMPFVPGSDVVGIVAAVGEGVGEIRKSQRVLASSWNGGLARRALLPVGAHVVAVPQAADAGELAALPMAGLTALHILRLLGDVTGRTIAILGATGGVGLALLQQLSAAGAHVVASASADDADLVTANGASETVDYTQTDFVDDVRRRRPDGVDILIDLVSQFDALLASARAVRDGGTLLSTLFGPEPSAFGKRITVVYSRLKAEPGDLAQLAGDYVAGRLRANVGAAFAFAEGRDACLALQDRHVRGKIVVRM